MKKKTTSTNHITVISGVQKHPIRYKLWKIFSQTYVKRLTMTFGIVALIFVAGSIIYVNRIAVTNAVYAAFGLDLSELATELASGGTQTDSYVTTDVKVNSESLGLVDTSSAEPVSDDIIAGYLIEPETTTENMTPTAEVSDEDVRGMSDAAQANADDNFEEETYGGGGYDD